FDWFATQIHWQQRESKGPLLTADVPEEGTDLPTIYQEQIDKVSERFKQDHAELSWQQFDAQVRNIFVELQQAWTTLQWERARPYETDNIFQMHLFWITEYQRQHLRNLLDKINIEDV